MNDPVFWVIQTGEPVHTDPGMPRVMRGMATSDAVTLHGAHAVFFTAAFNHHAKRHRTRNARRVFLPSGLELVYVPSPGYRHNIGLKRLLDHAVLARGMKREMCAHPLPSAAFVGFPPIEVAWSAARYLRQNCVPFMIDVKDQWPLIFVNALPTRLRGVGRLMLDPYFRIAKSSLRLADGISAMSGSFLAWAQGFGGRTTLSTDLVVPFTRPILSRIEGGKQTVLAKTMVFLATNLESDSYDMSGIRHACERLREMDPGIEVVVTGKIPSDHFIEKVFGAQPNVRFTGLLDSSQITDLLESAFCTVAPYVRSDAFERSLPNKVIESIAFGVPVITTLRGEPEQLLSEHQCGVVYDPADSTALATVLESLVLDADQYGCLRRGAEQASSLFDHDTNYGALVSHLLHLRGVVRSRYADE